MTCPSSASGRSASPAGDNRPRSDSATSVAAWKVSPAPTVSRTVTAGAATAQVPARTAAALILRAVALNLLNPKLTLFFLAFLPQFMSTAYAPGAQLMVLSGVFMAATFVVFLAYGLAAHALRGAVLSSPRVQDWLRRSFAAAFAALGARLALADR